MPNDSLKKLYIDELKDLYSAENQLVKAFRRWRRLLPRTNCEKASKSSWSKPRGM